MPNARWSGLLVAVALSLAPGAPVNAAPPPPDAERAAAVESFRRGTQLVEAGQMQQAIDAFREALRHEPASVGARLDLADCYEKIGSPASAWREYAIAESHARTANDPRKEMARSSSAHLEASLLLVRFAAARVDGMELRVDGEPVAQEILARAAIALAPGRHHVEVSAPGKRPFAEDVAGGAGETRSLAVAFDDDAPRAAATHDEPSEAPSSTQRTWGVALGVLGLAGVALGSVTGAIAVSDKSTLAQESHDATLGSARFYADRSTAETFANVSTAGLIAGGAALVAGVALYLTAPSRSGRSLRATVVPDALLVTATF